MSHLFRAASLSLLVMGCVADVETDAVEQQATSGSCTAFYCGGSSNSPEIDNLGMHDLNAYGLVNEGGFYIDEVKHKYNGYLYRIVVSKARLSAVSTNGGPALRMNNGTATLNDDLEHLQIYVKHTTNPGRYILRFIEESRVAYWARPNLRTHYTWSYELRWAGEVAPGQREVYENICSNPSLADNNNLNMNINHVVVFENDRIAEAKKTVEGPAETGWFNIGCAGHALAKLHLNGHTDAAQTATASLALPEYEKFRTTYPQRQTFLKMIVGDYCGGGIPFTVFGQPLQWADLKEQNIQYYSSPAVLALEAKWTENGAACLNKPRVDANLTSDGEALYAAAGYTSMKQMIAKTCGYLPPDCPSPSATDWSAEHIYSANP